MKERINRLSRGIVDAENPKLFLSPEAVEETIGSNTLYRRELYLSSENNLQIKGLAYSDHARVRILTPSFGGLRNRIAYEVDTSWCENGDRIEGTLSLVTNGGERTVPFAFTVAAEASVQVLAGLKTAEDFAELARKDQELALRLMEYEDFSEAPFMQDLHIRTIYEALRGRGSRQNALEEFLLALGVKEPVELIVQAQKKYYEDPREIVNDKLVLSKNTWGYLSIELKADGEFIGLEKKVITQADFTDDRMELRYRIHPERLHRGKNFGAIRLRTVHGETIIRIEATGGRPEIIRARDGRPSRAGICRYLKLREEYENGGGQDKELLGRIRRELEAMRASRGNSLLFTLLTAENALESGRKDEAAELLDGCRQELSALADESTTLFCFSRYLLYLLEPTPETKEALIRLLRRKLDRRKGRFYLHMLLLRLEPDLYGDDRNLLDSLREQYENGCASPFLYLEACRVIRREPELIKNADRFLIQVIFYGVGHDLIDEKTAERIAALAQSARAYDRLYLRALERLYEKYQTKELLAGVCCLMIRGNLRNAECFPWYDRGVRAEIRLTRLYEYYLYSIPEDYTGEIPRAVFLYFSYENSHLDRTSRAVLYERLLTGLKPEDPIYQSYEREMEKFAMEQLFESRIDGRLAVIYKHMIYRDVIDKEAAKVLPPILKTNRIRVDVSGMKYVIVCSEFLDGEDAYPLTGGTAYVPLFFEDSLLLFQDGYGNRYLAVPYEKEPVLSEPELLERCYEVYPAQPMLKMRECVELMKKPAPDAEELKKLERALDDLPVKPLYQQKMLKRVIDYYKERGKDEEGHITREAGTYLLRLDKKRLSREERIGVCETFITQNYLAESYDMVRQFGTFGLSTARLGRLCSGMILQRLFADDPLLLSLSAKVFFAGESDSIILDYLTEHFNGTDEQMYQILVQAVREHVETYDLEERLLGQLLFTGDMRYLDPVFDFYAGRKKTSEPVVRAYFTVKSSAYFLHDEVPGDTVFAYLEGAVNGADLYRTPEIYLLAVAKYYSGLPTLNEEQSALCRRIMQHLLGQNMVFAWFKKLSPYADLPGDILDKEIIEYHGNPAVRPTLRVRVLPDEEEFHDEELHMIYKGIYVAQKVLFEGEIMEYEIYEEENGTQIKKAEGEISCTEVADGDKGNRFSCLNAMNLYLGMKDDGKLREAMTAYLKNDAAAGALFPLA